MPTVLRIGAFRFYFYSHEPNEPPHIHVDRGEATIKIWLDVVEVSRSRGFRAREINDILAMVEDHRSRLLEAWHEYFG
ncbi:DUF4160 domain-containing protein [Sphingomonas sp. S-NIH.Pt15_0812]|jgi:hypothetical protein|uniref:DUF4160 domain-containing protein n=1 Tax=Sphingomonas sp. S-NIH.Pt15_0812 TaxID=1920129 RepID=UPI000F7D6648|nr:DUF4160 domain-containing protein [Sphingomonas sp. S-NIH.Pt15_0812]RSU54596.1 DUF4160 domain-containing protein [Sphingomonas sp. S-NIH.Pt15_0812]